MFSSKDEYLNGIMTVFGYGYIDEQQVVEIILSDDISFEELEEVVKDWIDEDELENIKEEYKFATE
jgi:hypothetical protein